MRMSKAWIVEMKFSKVKVVQALEAFNIWAEPA